MKIFINNENLKLQSANKLKDDIWKYYRQKEKNIPNAFRETYDMRENLMNADRAVAKRDRMFSKNRKSCFRKVVSCFILTILILFSACCNKKEQEQELVIFTVNDMHAAIDQFPKFAFIIDSLRSLYPDMLLFSAGDNQTGNPINDRYSEKGLPMVELMNAVKFNLSVVGNHEFDLGPEQQALLSRKAKFPLICANAFPPKDLDIKMSPYKIFSMKNGLKVAVLGLLQLAVGDIPSAHPDVLKGFQFKYFDKVLPEYSHLKDSCDIFVALTHLGIDDDVRLAKLCPQLDLIVGGHSHTLIEKEQIENGVLITQVGWKLRYAALIKFKIRNKKIIERKRELILISNAGGENKEIRAMVDKYNDNPTLKQVVAIAEDNFSSREELGYLMADAVRNRTGVDIAIQNRGGARLDELPKGEIRLLDLYRLEPFGNEIILLNLNGEELKALFVAAYSADEKRPTLSSGIKLEYFVNAKGELKDIVLKDENDQALDLSKSYRVASNSYLNAVYQYPRSELGKGIGKTTADLILEYFEKTKTIKSYREEKRFEIKNTKE